MSNCAITPYMLGQVTERRDRSRQISYTPKSHAFRLRITGYRLKAGKLVKCSARKDAASIPPEGLEKAERGTGCCRGNIGAFLALVRLLVLVRQYCI
jgi:hypothetical protein